MVNLKSSRNYGSWLPFLLELSKLTKALLLGFHRAHLSLRVLNEKNKIMSLKKHHIRESHERQFKGEDWQQVANDIWAGIPKATDEDFLTLCGSPDPGCDCGFCAKANWRTE